jgi:hypothetical protein
MRKFPQAVAAEVPLRTLRLFFASFAAKVSIFADSQKNLYRKVRKENL